MTRDFERLLFRADLSQYHRALWFGDCALVSSVILCPNAETRDALERLFGERLRAIRSDVTFRVGAVPKDEQPQRPQPKWRAGDIKPGWKPQASQTQRADTGRKPPPDMLDE